MTVFIFFKHLTVLKLELQKYVSKITYFIKISSDLKNGYYNNWFEYNFMFLYRVYIFLI